MFGSDWPVCKMTKEEDAYATQISLVKELTAHLNNEEKDNVFYNFIFQSNIFEIINNISKP